VSAFVKSELIGIKSHSTEKVFSLFNFPRSRWHLRSEAEFLFQQNSVSIEKVIFKDELESLDLKALSDNKQLKIILVDHNQTEKELYPYRESIIEVIDHHRDSSDYPHGIEKTIAPTGSCSTLIAEQFLDMLKTESGLLQKNKKKQLANLLYSAIRIDIEHLNNNSDYNLQRDKKALEELKPLTDIKESLFKELVNRKYDQSSYSEEDHLYKDYKQWDWKGISYGISTVFFNSRKESGKVMRNFIEKENIKILFLMHFLKKPILKRELTIAFSDSFPYKNEMLKAISGSELFIELSPQTFSQINPELSRKKIQPFIEELLKELKEN